MSKISELSEIAGVNHADTYVPAVIHCFFGVIQIINGFFDGRGQGGVVARIIPIE